MSILSDIEFLKSHFESRRTWYVAAIDSIESEIVYLWNDYFLMKGNKSLKLLEIERSFKILKESKLFFSESLKEIEKKLDDLKRQEYAILNNGRGQAN